MKSAERFDLGFGLGGEGVEPGRDGAAGMGGSRVRGGSRIAAGGWGAPDSKSEPAEAAIETETDSKEMPADDLEASIT